MNSSCQTSTSIVPTSSILSETSIGFFLAFSLGKITLPNMKPWFCSVFFCVCVFVCFSMFFYVFLCFSCCFCLPSDPPTSPRKRAADGGVATPPPKMKLATEDDVFWRQRRSAGSLGRSSPHDLWVKDIR